MKKMATTTLATMATSTTWKIKPGTGTSGHGAASMTLNQNTILQKQTLFTTTHPLPVTITPGLWLMLNLKMKMHLLTTRMATSTCATMITHTTTPMEPGSGTFCNGTANTTLSMMFITLLTTISKLILTLI